MANHGYDVVVDVDTEGDLGHTDLQEDNLEFHSSDFSAPKQTSSSTPFLNSSQAPHASSSPRPSSGGFLSFLSPSHYTTYFDVDTSTVLSRCFSSLTALLPTTPPFLDTLDGRPDLYGPFWIATTVVVILFLTGTISAYLASEGKKHFAYDFGLLGGSAGLVYGYTFGVPLILWAVLRWTNGWGSAGGAGLELVEAIALYGYADLVWVGVALGSWIPIAAVNWVLVGVGLLVSGGFLGRNLWRVVGGQGHGGGGGRVLLVGLVLAHVGLAIAIKVLFFAHGSPVAKGGNDGDKKGEKGDDKGKGDGARMLW